MSPFFSIVIATLNSGKTLKRCLDSVFEQTFKDFEVLIIDSFSFDETSCVVDSFVKRFPNSISFYSERDKGVYDGLNKGLAISKGRFVYFLGSDDWFFNSFVLNEVYLFSKRRDCRVIYGNVLINGDASWAKSNEVYAGVFSRKRLIRKNICHQSIFYSRKFLNSFGLKFNLLFPIHADWDFNLRCARLTRFHYIDIIVANFSSGGLSDGVNKFDSFYSQIPVLFPDLMPKRIEVLASRFKKMFQKWIQLE